PRPIGTARSRKSCPATDFSRTNAPLAKSHVKANPDEAAITGSERPIELARGPPNTLLVNGVPRMSMKVFANAGLGRKRLAATRPAHQRRIDMGRPHSTGRHGRPPNRGGG